MRESSGRATIAALIETSLEALESGRPPRLATHSVSALRALLIAGVEDGAASELVDTMVRKLKELRNGVGDPLPELTRDVSTLTQEVERLVREKWCQSTNFLPKGLKHSVQTKDRRGAWERFCGG